MKTAPFLVRTCLLNFMLDSLVHAQNDADLAKTKLAKNAEQILKTNCYRCHGQDGAAEGRFNYLLDVPTLISRGRVLPGDAAKSKLFTVIEKQHMPPEDEEPRPSKDDIATLKAWIDAGAPDFNPVVAKRTFVTTEDMLRDIFLDLHSLEEFDRKFARYFTLTHLYNAGLSDDNLQTYRIGLSRLINSLSWGRRVEIPQAINSRKTIFRIDLRDYRWKSATWEQLVAANPFGILYNSPIASSCYSMTGSTQPFVRGDWFVFAASVPPLYHELLEIPKTDIELEKTLQVNVKENIRERQTARAGFNGSGVSQNNRMIERHELDLTNGAYWKSYDFGSSTGKQNIFNHPLSTEGASSFQQDGGEIIFNLPNGLQAYMLVDAKGTRIDKGPTSIVSDPKRPDRAVVNGLSCMSCHNQGMIEKEDQIRQHVEVNRNSFGTSEADLILGLYPGTQKMNSFYKEDTERFVKAVEKTGQKLDAKGRIVGTDPVVILASLFEQELDLNLASAEASVLPEEFLIMLERDAQLSRTLGAVRNQGGTIKREAFVSVFSNLVRDLKLGQFIAVKTIPSIPVKVVPPSVPAKVVPPPLVRTFPEQNLFIKQRSTTILSGGDGSVKVHVGDIEGGKKADVEITNQFNKSLATKKDALVGDRIAFSHQGKVYEVQVIRYESAFTGGDSAQLKLIPR